MSVKGGRSKEGTGSELLLSRLSSGMKHAINIDDPLLTVCNFI